jgi:hypothetical protein
MSTSRSAGIRWLPLAGCLVLLAAGGAEAMANAKADTRDAKLAEAKEHFARGETFFKVDRYKEAMAEYEAAYLARPDANFLYNIGQCHRLMGNKSDALRFYRRFLRDKPQTSNRAIVEKHIRDIEAQLAAGGGLAPTGGASAAPVVPATPAAPAPTGPGATASPASDPAPASASHPGTVERGGPTLALAPSPGKPARDSLMVPGGAEAPTSNDDRGPVYGRWWFWALIGGMVLGGVVVGVVLSRQNQEPGCDGLDVCN